MEYFGYIVLSLAILLCMVLIHEFGHYTAAKILGFTVEEFSVGFGPKIFSRVRKNGERFSLRLLPLGGFCSFLGDSDEDDVTPTAVAPAQTPGATADEDLLSHVMREKAEEDLEKLNLDKNGAKIEQKSAPRLDKDGNPVKTFYEQKPWKRIIVLLGGVLFNFLSAIIFSLIYIWSVGYAVPCITDVYVNPDGAPYSAVQKGDIIVGVNGNRISVVDSYGDLAQGFGEGDRVTLTVNRNGETLDIAVVRQQIATLDADGNPLTYVGFGFATMTAFADGTAGDAFKYCVPYTFKLSWAILGSFGQLITGKAPITSLSGPVGSIKMMADVSIANWRNILILLPLLASNLAMFNILPFPALDGAQIIFTIVEWIRKKPINRKVQGIINFVGLAVLLLFVLIVDILSFVL